MRTTRAARRIFGVDFNFAVRTQTVDGAESRGSVENYNLTTLFSYDPTEPGGGIGDLYAGAGINRYRAHFRTDVAAGERRAWTPSGVVGVRFEGSLGRMGLEAAGTWITERDGRRDFVCMNRLYMSAPFSAWNL